MIATMDPSVLHWPRTAGSVVALPFIPNNVLEEDPKLFMWYDHALARMSS